MAAQYNPRRNAERFSPRSPSPARCSFDAGGRLSARAEAAAGADRRRLSRRVSRPSTGPDAAPERAVAAAARPSRPRRSTLRKLDAIEPLVEQAIADKKLPGAVVLIGRGDRIAVSEGDRQPRARAGRRADDARHDLRPGVADQGGRDDDQRDDAGRGRQDPAQRSRVATFIPGFERYGKANITIRHLMTHTSGLRPDLDLADAVDRARHGDRARDRRSAARRRPASASSTATSTSSCSATSSGA